MGKTIGIKKLSNDQTVLDRQAVTLAVIGSQQSVSHFVTPSISFSAGLTLHLLNKPMGLFMHPSVGYSPLVRHELESQPSEPARH